jgi:hypothetical protein
VRLSDIMSSMQLGSYAEVAMLLFLGAFVAVAVSIFWGRDTKEWERCRHLPLDGAEDGAPVASDAPIISTATGRHEP